MLGKPLAIFALLSLLMHPSCYSTGEGVVYKNKSDGHEKTINGQSNADALSGGNKDEGAVNENTLFKSLKPFPSNVDVAEMYGGLDVDNGFVVGDVPSPTKQTIIFSRTEMKLRLFKDNKLIKTVTATAGRGFNFMKEREGDNVTPLGVYYIVGHNPGSHYHKSMQISYPAVADAKRGLRTKLITLKVYDEIARAQNLRKAPPRKTGLGHDIMIHGETESSFVKLYCGVASWITNKPCEWSSGCIAMSNGDIDEIYGNVEDLATVVVLP